MINLTLLLQQTEQEIVEVEAEIEGLEQSLADKVPPMMVVHTRLENRTLRPNVELCRDTSQYGMVEEVAEIAESQLQLQEKLDVARYDIIYNCKFVIQQLLACLCAI